MNDFGPYTLELSPPGSNLPSLLVHIWQIMLQWVYLKPSWDKVELLDKWRENGWLGGSNIWLPDVG